MCTPLPTGFDWRERQHDADPFHINPHRKVHTLYFDDHPIASIEPSGRGLVVRFLSSVLDTPGRPIAVPTVPRGKTFVQNWVRPRLAQVVSVSHYARLRQDAA